MQKPSDNNALLNSATYANGYNPLIQSSNSIGFRPNPLRYAARSYQNIAEDFLINSYTTRNDIENNSSLEQYGSDTDLTMLSLMERRDYGESKKILLPESIPLGLSVGDCIVRRRSARTYTGDRISLQYVASILRSACGITTQATVRSNQSKSIEISLRTVASAGGLYPVNCYVVLLNVNKVKQGIYKYSTSEDALYQVDDHHSVDRLLKSYAASNEDITFSRANFIVLLAGNTWKAMRKYGNKGLRFIFHEIGSASQNMHLASIALGIGSVDCAALYENEMNELFGFDGINQSILHSIVFGIHE